MQQCFEFLNNIEYIAKEAEDVCQDHLYVHETDRMRCHKTGEICKRAIIFCERVHGLGSKICDEKKDLCLTRVNNTLFLKEKLEKMAKNSRLSRLNIQASIKSRSGKSSAQTAFSYGSTVLDNGHTVKYYTGVEIFLTENSSEYQLALESKVAYPKIKNYWNVTALLDEDLKMNVEAKLSYGPTDHLKVVELKSKLEKSVEHIKDVRESPEFVSCLDDMQKNQILSQSCIQVRHQALSLNKIFVAVKLSDEVDQELVLQAVEQLSQFYFDSQMTVSPNLSEISPKELSLTFDLSRTGNEAQLEISKFGQKMIIKNIRLQQYFERIVPITFENQSPKNLIQKLSYTQAPCYIEQHHIRTFDGSMFDYEINDCNHLLFKDCSEKVPMAVLAKSEPGSKSGKIIQILSGSTHLVIRPKSKTQNNGLIMEHLFKKSKRVIHFNNVTSSHTEICPDSKEILFEINYYHDEVYKIWFNKEKLEVNVFFLCMLNLESRFLTGRDRRADAKSTPSYSLDLHFCLTL